MLENVYKQFEKSVDFMSYAQIIALKHKVDAVFQKMTNQQSTETTYSKSKVDEINSVLAKIPQEEQLQYCDVGIESVREALKNDTW